MDILLSMLMFALGFLAGGAAAVVVLFISRTRAEAAQAGDDLLEGLGPVGARKFIEAAQE
jgi:hypothetical protein